MAETIDPNVTAPPLFPTFGKLLAWRRNRRWRTILAASELPTPIVQLIGRVIKRTRLWQREKRAVARELISHFHDGLAAGESAQTLIERFGDPVAAARLIRRAKKRNRPLIWHAWRYLFRGFLIMLGIYAFVLLRFFLSHPTVKINYIEKLNGPTLAAPHDQWAWPLYRQAILGLGMKQGEEDKALAKELGHDADDNPLTLDNVKPGDTGWPFAVQWLDAHAAAFETLRQAAAKPVFGFVLGPNGSQHDAELGWHYGEHDPENRSELDTTMISILLPSLNHLRQLATLLGQDLRYAQTQHDSDRALADIHAMLGIAAQQRDPILITRLVAIGIDALTFDRVQHVLATDPQLFSDEQLIDLAHRIAKIGGDSPGSLLDLSGERMFFYDLVQRSYTDDGHGDGILTPAGARMWQDVIGVTGKSEPDRNFIELGTTLALGGAMSTVTSRKELTREYDRLMDLAELGYSRPLRESAGPNGPFAQYQARAMEIKNSPLLEVKFLPIAILLPSLERAAMNGERTLGQREGLEVGIALELYHRQHGTYPSELTALTPTFLPAVPADRITGEPIKYRLIDGHPVVYSVGVDRDDDGGRMAEPQKGKPIAVGAAEWDADAEKVKQLDGDWVLFDGRPEMPTTQPTK